VKWDQSRPSGAEVKAFEGARRRRMKAPIDNTPEPSSQAEAGTGTADTG
jgi:hypothetical protein